MQGSKTFVSLNSWLESHQEEEEEEGKMGWPKGALAATLACRLFRADRPGGNPGAKR